MPQPRTSQALSAPALRVATADHWIGLWLALALLLFYLLGYSGLFHSIDEHASLAVTESLLIEGRWRTNQMAWEQIWEPSQNAIGLDGNLYSKKGTAIPLLALPFFALGKLWPGIGAVQTALLLIPLISAATAYLFYQLARRLNFAPGTAILGALAWGTATPAWPYARTLFSEPVAAFGLCLALFGMVSARRFPQRSVRWLFVAGGGMALIMLARQANTVTLLPFGLYWLYLLWEDRAALRPARLWREALALGALPVLALLWMMAQSYAHFGHLLGHPLDPVEGFTTPIVVGLAGLLISPGKGLLWYLPLVLVIPLGLPHWRRQRRLPEFLLAFAVFVIPLLLYSLWWDWPGGTAWGPRLILFTTPALILMALPALAQIVDGAGWRRIAVITALLVSILAQLPGVLVNTGVLEGWEFYIGVTQEQRLWTWPHAPLISHWRSLLMDRIVEPLWLQPFFWQQPLWRIVITLGMALIATISIFYGLGMAWQRRLQPRAFVIAAISLIFFMGMLPIAAQGDPRWHERGAEPEDNQQLWAYLTETAQRDDIAVVDMLLYYDMLGRTAAWMNAGPPQLPYIGWVRTPVGEDPLPLTDWLDDYNRVWLSLAMTPPGSLESTTERWLDGWAFRGRQIWFGTQRLVEYLLPAAEPIATSTASFRFGDDLWLDNFTVRPGKDARFRLIELEWRGVDDPDSRLSVQILDQNGQLLTQHDQPPGSLTNDRGTLDRIAIAAPSGSYLLILKSYNAATGEAFSLFTTEGHLVGDYLVLDERPKFR
ncbi:MAG: hypothetical protein KF893_11395 [Caldilineaceae bacterium]|nr:hypothetical protein [Caldilineaceae bacterium]